MCTPAGFVLTKDHVFWSINSDSHDSIIHVHNLVESVCGKPSVLRVEITPPDGDLSSDTKDWVWKIDQDILPAWADATEDEARTRDELKNWLVERVMTSGRRVIQNARVFLYGDSFAKLAGDSFATLHDNSSATFTGDSFATLHDNSSATFIGNSFAKLTGNSRAMLRGGSRAELHDNSSATLHDASSAKLFNNSSAKLFNNSSAELFNNSSAELHGGSFAKLHDSSSAKFHDSSSAKLHDNCKSIHHPVEKLFCGDEK